MSITLESVNRINSLKAGIESTTGEQYTNLTDAIQGLKDGYGTGGGSGEVDNTAFKQFIERSTKNLKLPDDLTSIGNYAFYNNTTYDAPKLPDGITKIGVYAFFGCTGLYLEEGLPSKLQSIGNNAFSGCRSLSIETLPEGLTTIGSNGFYNCESIAIEDIPSTVTSIGGAAFRGCENLYTLAFHSKVNSLSNNAFINCTNLTDIYVPWGEGEVANAPWGAPNATIHYNTKYDENNKPIVEG